MRAATSLIDQTIASVLWLMIGRWGQMALGFATLAIMARFVGPEVYGLFALSYIVVGLSDALVNGAVAEALIQRQSLERRHENAVFWLSIGPAIVLALAMLLGGGVIADLFRAPDLAPVLVAMSAVALLAGFSAIPAALLQRAMRHRAIVAIDNGVGVLGSIVGITLAVAGAGVWSLVAMELVRVAARTIALMRTARWRPRVATDRAAFADVWPFGRQVMAIRLLQYIDKMTPRAALGLALGPVAVGYYALGWRIYDQVQKLLVAPMASVAMPAAARAQDDLPTLRAMLVGATRASSMIAYPAFIGAAALAPVAIPLLFGAQWAPAVPAVQLLTLIGVRGAVSAFNGGVIRGLGRPDLQLQLVAIGATATLVLVPIAAPFGVAAAAAAILARSFLTWPIGAWHVQRLTGLPAWTQARVGMEALAAALLMAACVIGLQHAAPGLSPIMLCGISIVAGAIVYLATFALIEPRMARTAVRATGAMARGDHRAARKILGEAANNG